MQIRHIVPSLIVLCSASTTASALDHFVVGPRAQGMAGANVASTNDETAQYYNPGAFGFMANAAAEGSDADFNGSDNNDTGRRDFGFGLDVGVQYRLTGTLTNLIDEFQDIDFDRLESLNTLGDMTAQDVAELSKIISLLPKIGDPGNQVQGLINGGVGVQVGRFAVGARNFTGISAYIDSIDLTNLGFDYPDMSDFNTDIENATAGTVPGSYTNQHFTGSRYSALSAAGFSDDAITAMDYYLDQNLDTGIANFSDIEEQVDLLVSVADSVSGVGGGGDLADNTTSVVSRGVGWVEVPVTYGYQVTDNISVGVSAKYMLGRVYGFKVRVFDDNLDIGDVISDALDDYKETSTFGIDAGVMLRLPTLQLGLVGRNLNTPTFDGFYNADLDITLPDAELEPEIVAGAAFIPIPTLTLEASLDLVKHDAVNSYYETQYAAVGAEWDVLRFLALRGGISTNLAEDDIGPVVDVGVGINLALLRIDVAAGAALETEDFDGTSLPAEGHLSIGLSSRW